MKDIFKAIKITDKVYWVGAVDWKIRDFHGYSTNRGSTFNAYLILADKITLIDTVKADFKDEFLTRLSSIVNLEDIDYIISNHSEMDHSGLLPEMIDLIKPEKVFASTMGVKALSKHFPQIADKLTPLKDGETVSLGNMNIKAYETKMLHWPDSMFSYLEEEEILFSNDMFGMHLASYQRFDYEMDECILKEESAKYFANIFMPYCSFVTKAMEKIKSENLKIKYIATDHGVIWQKNVDKIIQLYTDWALQKPTNKAVVIFDTMWGSTAKMARIIGEGLSSEGLDVKVLPVGLTHRSDIATQLLESGALIIGSPVINNNIYPTMVDVTSYLSGLKLKNLVCGAFGSYGWSPASLDQLKVIVESNMGFELAEELLKANYVPNEEELKACYNFGVNIAKHLKEKL